MRVRTVLPIFVFVALCGRLAAQTTFATITGSVGDPNGLAVVGATVEAMHVATNYRYAVQTNEAGVYTLAQLREGEYTLRAQSAGFKEWVAREVRLVAQDHRRIDIRFEIGSVETTVEVTAGAALIETETARVSDTKGDLQLKALPVNSRGLTAYLSLSPGVLASSSGDKRFSGSAAQNQSDASIDGITISNMQNGTQISPLTNYVESFQEVRVDSANNSAEFGAVGQITVVSKSGSNAVHGSLFDYYSTPWFRARNPFSPQRPTGITHNPGGSIGGPVYLPKVYDGRNRTFFFYSFETTRGSATNQLFKPTVPLASWRAGDFSALPPGTVVKDPFAGTPFPGNRIPGSRVNGVAQKIQERFYPLPNAGNPDVLTSMNYQELKPKQFNPTNYYTMRFDHRFSDKSFLYGRWTWNRFVRHDYDGSLPTVGIYFNQRDTRALNISHTYSLRQNLINEFRWGLAYNDNPRNGPLMGKEVVKDLGLQGLNPDLPDIQGIFKVNFSGLGVTGISQTDWRHPGFKNYPMQFQELLSWFHGRHSVKGGLFLSRIGYGDGQANGNLFGSATFSNRFAGHPYADFLMGIPTTSSRAPAPLILDGRRWGYDMFVSDDFKVTSRLTVNMGLRYELHPPLEDTSGYMSVFDLGSGKIVVPNGRLSKVSPLLPKSYVDVVEANAAGLPSKLIRSDTNNFAPRIGVAWRPFGNKTVFRAGYGIFYNVVPDGVPLGGTPYVINEPSFTNPSPNPTVVLPLVFPVSVGGPSTISIPRAVRADLRTPFSMQYNATIEHERWNTGFRLSYIGTNTRQDTWTYNINQPVSDTRLFADKMNERRFPRYPGINYLSNGAGHQYHSMTVEAKRHYSHGLYHQISWVWARDIGDGSPENAYDRARERGVAGTIPTHRVTGNVIYELPFGKGRSYLSGIGRGLNLLVGGWELSGVYAYNSGEFLTATWSGPDPTGTAYTTSRTPAQVSIRPDQLRDPNLPADQRSILRWFDVAAFGAPRPGQWGSSSNGAIKGPGATVWHAGVAKYFALVERMKIRWELTATNILNHPNWSNPGTTVTSLAQAGVITGVGGVSDGDQTDPRAFRMGLRLEW